MTITREGKAELTELLEQKGFGNIDVDDFGISLLFAVNASYMETPKNVNLNEKVCKAATQK